jgi:iron complex outermembrane receptor protein
VRGSIGTGFHAPTVPQLNATQRSYGVTVDNYNCSELPDLQAIAASLGAECRPDNQQYDQLAGGNKDLKPEKSRNATFGLRYEPTNEYSLGADFWWVAIKDAFGQLTEQTVFNNPGAFPNQWGTLRDVGTGTNYVALILDNLNLGNQYTSGIDFDLQGRWRTPIGQVNSQILATYMLRDDVQLEKNGRYFTALGQNDSDLGTVTFRWQARWTTSLVMDQWTHTLGFNYKSGYKDQTQNVEVLDDAGNVTGFEDVRLKVKDYYTFDIQSKWRPIKQVEITLGILNLFDKDPPFSIQTNAGQVFGYDPRYYDPRGRTFYGNASYKF